MNESDFLASVSLEVDASPDDVAAVEAVFESASIPATVDATVHRASVGNLPWLVYITAPVMAFLSALGAAAGGDAWQALKALAENLIQVRRRSGKPDGAIRLDDEDRSLTVIITHGLPNEAYRQLAEWGRAPEHGYLVWDTGARRWRNYGPGS